MNKLEEIQHLNKIINEIPAEKKEEFVTYLTKFLPSTEPTKDECCLKYLIRPSGRHCHNCPHHPLRGPNDSLNKFIQISGTNMIRNKDYIGFIELLKKYELPYPVIEEIYELMV